MEFDIFKQFNHQLDCIKRMEVERNIEVNVIMQHIRETLLRSDVWIVLQQFMKSYQCIFVVYLYILVIYRL